MRRAEILREIRSFFHNQGFIETDTPLAVPSPGMEPHIRPFLVQSYARCGTRPRNLFLHTSPEFAMKKLLARGFDRIFQICKTFRDEPKSTTHNPEFTMLEWYRANAGYEEIMDDVEGLFEHLVKKIGQPSNDVIERPWPRLTIEECFRRFAKIDHVQNLSEDEFFLTMMNDVEPELHKMGRPVIVYNYPEKQAALSNVFTDERGLKWGKRFEVYAGGFELANAFDELIDPVEQKKRFEKDMQLRQAIYGESFPSTPIDNEFLDALAKMPRSGGIALGVDRLVMYFTGTKNIGDVQF